MSSVLQEPATCSFISILDIATHLTVSVSLALILYKEEKVHIRLLNATLIVKSNLPNKREMGSTEATTRDEVEQDSTSRR